MEPFLATTHRQNFTLAAGQRGFFFGNLARGLL